ncbi:uncharacterized protein RHO25_001895 [Cercospora beticola]|uniref:Hypervirulence associated protein TUDOR domain-containing protein n=1 Tax=Cercospora beticola TaxID=122368 RepID=A0ABZ0NCM7_CERBT|nr:hypothetical protein RHO25_001895 [Cercospora beticola]
MGRQERKAECYYQSEGGPSSAYSTVGSNSEGSPTTKKRTVVLHQASGTVSSDEKRPPPASHRK